MLNLDEGITVLSLFDGMSCGRIALDRAGIKVKAYYASEIDKPAMKVAKHNWPDIIHIGDVTKVYYYEGTLYTENGNFYVGKIDMIIGGSPCQGFSFAGKQLNFEDPRSKLFFEFVRLREETECEYFFLENVRMKREYQDIISQYLGVEPVFINSALVSAQSRKRLYWSNIPYNGPPANKEIYLKDILLNHEEFCLRWQNSDTGFVFDRKSGTLRGSTQVGIRNRAVVITYDFNLSDEEINRAVLKYKGKTWSSGNRMGNMIFPDKINKKSKALCKTLIKGSRETIHIQDGENTRVLTPIEAERLQTLPDNYTKGVSVCQSMAMIGNGWTVDVIVHLFEPLKCLDIL